MSLLNRRGLSEELNMNFSETEVYTDVQDDIESDLVSPTEEILRNNIARANRILDRVEFEMANGNFQPRLVEVAGQLINAVSTAVANLNTTEYNFQHLQLKNRMVSLKEAEVKIKQGTANRPTNQNIIVTDRETILRMLENKDKKLIGEGE